MKKLEINQKVNSSKPPLWISKATCDLAQRYSGQIELKVRNSKWVLLDKKNRLTDSKFLLWSGFLSSFFGKVGDFWPKSERK